MDDDIKYLVGLSHWPGFGLKKLEYLLKNFGPAKKIWAFGPKLNSSWKNDLDLDREIKRLSRQEIKLIPIESKNYPKLLKETDYAPFLLYVKGSIKLLNAPGITVVGSRKMTVYGRRATKLLVSRLAKKLTIVSGLARGVDGWSHRVCLENGGRTLAVLGHGLDRIYPPEHRFLAEDIIKAGGALISELPFGYPLEKQNFPRRDRILAGLTLGTLVIEGGERSGTKITAGFAADYGREVFCVSGPIDSPSAVGPAELVRQGAVLVTGARDIFRELNIDSCA